MADKAATKRVSLTNTFLEKATCPDDKDRAYFYDTRTPGLAVCVTKAGRRTFYLIRRIRGRPERVRLGRFPDISIVGARRKAAIANSQVAERGDPKALLRTSRGAAGHANVATTSIYTHVAVEDDDGPGDLFDFQDRAEP